MPVYKESDIQSEKITAGYSRKIFHLDNLMVTVCEFSGGPAAEPDPPHSHIHEQITYVAEGELYFNISGVKHHLTKGDVITIPSGIPHCIQIISNYVRLIDSFSPIRNDFLK